MSGLRFAPIPLDIMSMTEISANAKLLYARLLLYIGKNSKAWPSQETLAADLGISVRSIKRTVAELAQAELIERQQKNHRSSNEYRLCGVPDLAPAGTKSGPPGIPNLAPIKEQGNISMKNKEVSSRGTRIKSDWRPSEINHARQTERTDAAFVERTIEYFINYWIAVPGQRGLKLDWDRTFANWISSEIDRGKYKPVNRGSAHSASHANTEKRRAGLAGAYRKRMAGVGKSDAIH